MPRISTDNYDTVASWNGSQDLFVVEQPDGTKVATPAMVKQFIQAGDFVATGEVKDGHGNILADMAKSADVDEIIGDLSQTGLTGDSVAEQLSTAKNQIANKIKIVSVTITTTADGIASVFYNSDIKLGKVIGVYLDNPASTYRFCTMMVNPVPDRFYIFVYNYNLAPVANTTVSLFVVCYD